MTAEYIFIAFFSGLGVAAAAYAFLVWRDQDPPQDHSEAIREEYDATVSPLRSYVAGMLDKWELRKADAHAKREARK